VVKRIGDVMSYESIEKIDLCKYAEVVSLGKPIECKYKNSIAFNGMFFPACPMDSGTDGKCNNKCAEVHFQEVEANQD
jgi:hypothetical protein